MWRGGASQSSPLHKNVKNKSENMGQSGGTSCSDFWSPTIFQVASSKSMTFFFSVISD